MLGAPRISLKQLAQMCRRVGTALHAGVDVRTVWDREAQRGPARQRREIQRIQRAVARGDNMADALNEADGFFPNLLCEMVDVGEKTGKVDEVLLRLAGYYDHLLKLRRIFLAGIAWPAIQFGATVVIVGLIIWIMGAISQITGQEADILGFGLVGTRGLIIYMLGVAAATVVCAVLVRGLLRGWFWAGPVMNLLMATPALGHAIRTMALARMAWSLALATESGMDARHSMRIAIGSTQNVHFTRHVGQVDRQLAHGDQMHEALRSTGDYPPEFLDTLEVGETSGRLSESMESLSTQYQERAQTAYAALTAAATFATWCLVAMVVIFLIFRVAMFYINTIYDVLDSV